MATEHRQRSRSRSPRGTPSKSSLCTSVPDGGLSDVPKHSQAKVIKRHLELNWMGPKLVGIYLTGGIAEFAKQLPELISGVGGMHAKGLQQVACQPGMIPNVQIREACAAKLFSGLKPRPVKKLQQQIAVGLDIPQSSVHVDTTLHTGTIAEVSSCCIKLSKDQTIQCVVKTANLEQKQRYEIDIQAASGGMLRGIEGVLSKLPTKVAGLVLALVRQTAEVARDPVFRSNIMREFDMEFEANNVRKGQHWLSELNSQFEQRSLGLFRAVSTPQILRSNSHVMVMECVPGYNLAEPPSSMMSPEIKQSIVSDLILVHLHGLLCGPVLHCDLHPGNIIIHPEHHGMTLVDWNPLITVPPEDRKALRDLMMQLHTSSGFSSMDNYASLGVRPREGVQIQSTASLQMGKLYNLCSMVSGAFNLTECLLEFQKFHFPEWMLLWQKATMAVSNTLVHLSATPDVISARIDDLLRGPLNLS